MIDLKNSPVGFKRKVYIEGISGWDISMKQLSVIFRIEILNNSGVRVNDKAVEQDRIVTYRLNNDNLVNGSFNPVQTGGTGEYDFFMNLIDTSLFKLTILQLGGKLNERGIFD